MDLAPKWHCPRCSILVAPLQIEFKTRSRWSLPSECAGFYYGVLHRKHADGTPVASLAPDVQSIQYCCNCYFQDDGEDGRLGRREFQLWACKCCQTRRSLWGGPTTLPKYVQHLDSQLESMSLEKMLSTTYGGSPVQENVISETLSKLKTAQAICQDDHMQGYIFDPRDHDPRDHEHAPKRGSFRGRWSIMVARYQGVLTSVELQDNRVLGEYLAKIRKITANILLASEIGKPEDFKRLVDRNGTLDASPISYQGQQHVPRDLCAHVITAHAAIMMQSSGVQCLDIRSNPQLIKVPAAQLCSIDSLVRIECTDCPLLVSPPQEVASVGAKESMDFLRECVTGGEINKSLCIFLLGDGEVGKTSFVHAVMNEEGNFSLPIAKDTRTVGMDMYTWQTKDNHGMDLTFHIKDVGGQKVYMKTHELFVLDRAIYLYLWRPDTDTKKISDNVTLWLNLLQSRVPGVSVLPIVTHIDCVSTTDLEQQCDVVKNSFGKWVRKQKSMQNPEDIPIVRILNHAESLHVNCLKGDGVAVARSAIKDAAEKTRGYHEPLPNSWLNLRERISELAKGKRFITWQEYCKECRECHIEDKMLLVVTSFLHETSVLRFFGLPALRLQNENFDYFLRVFLSTKDGEEVEVKDNSIEGRRNTALALFQEIDKERSGSIDADALRKFVEAKGIKNANIKLMMQSAGDDCAGKIHLETFCRCFDLAQLEEHDKMLLCTVYIDIEWMIDILKGIVRHDHGALLQYFQEGGDLSLWHHTRRLRVHGIVAENLLDFLWPGISSPLWHKVETASADAKNYQYEMQLWWDDRTKGLKKVVETEDDKKKALGLLEGFKVILPLQADRSEFFCPDLVPPHKMETIDVRSIDKMSCEYWLTCTFAELPIGFWTALFMEIRSKCTSGRNSTSIQIFFVLGAKIQIKKINDKTGDFRIEVRASTDMAFGIAKGALFNVSKSYRGISVWKLSKEEISLESREKIIEPAQILVMTAASLWQKTANTIATFNKVMSYITNDLSVVRRFVDEDDLSCQRRCQPKLKKSVELLMNFQSRLNTSGGGDHFTGTFLLDDISSDLANFFHGVILPKYGSCVQYERERESELRGSPASCFGTSSFLQRRRVCPQWNVQDVDASRAPSRDELNEKLYIALKWQRIEEAKKLLFQGADPTYISTTSCFFVKSCVAEASKCEKIEHLLYSFCCDENQAIELPHSIKFQREKGKQIEKKFLEIENLRKTHDYHFPFSADDTANMHVEWIKTFDRVIDVHFRNISISRAICSPHNMFDGSVQVVLVLLGEEDVSRWPQLCDRFRKFHEAGSKIIGVPLPGYVITDYNKWWPKCMSEFEDHSLFFDCRLEKEDPGGNRWKDKMHRELMPQVQQFLEEWAAQRNFQQAGSTTQAPKPGRPLEARTYISKDEMRECVIPCPSCMKEGMQTPGVFSRDECMLFYLAKERASTKGTLICNICGQKVKVKDILKRPIFLSYNWGFNKSTQRLAIPLCKRIFLATEMPVWIDIDGGMGFGDELGAEMREGVEDCDIVILLISDAYCNSGNCLCEFIHAVKNNKYIIPLLAPDHGETRTGCSGWTGGADECWWEHAERICNPKGFDLPDHPMSASFEQIPWNYLASFSPIDLRRVSSPSKVSSLFEGKEDFSLQGAATVEPEIIQRVMSRFFRAGRKMVQTQRVMTEHQSATPTTANAPLDHGVVDGGSSPVVPFFDVACQESPTIVFKSVQGGGVHEMAPGSVDPLVSGQLGLLSPRAPETNALVMISSPGPVLMVDSKSKSRDYGVYTERL